MMFGLFKKKETPALKPAPRCCKVTVYVKNQPAPIEYSAPDPLTELFVTRKLDDFICVQVEHEEHENRCALAAHHVDNVVLVTLEHAAREEQ